MRVRVLGQARALRAQGNEPGQDNDDECAADDIEDAAVQPHHWHAGRRQSRRSAQIGIVLFFLERFVEPASGVFAGSRPKRAEDFPIIARLEAAVPSMEYDVADLPSKDFFLKTLTRPHYEGEDANGVPPWAYRRRRALPPAPAQPQKPQQQVRNEPPVALVPAQGQ